MESYFLRCLLLVALTAPTFGDGKWLLFFFIIVFTVTLEGCVRQPVASMLASCPMLASSGNFCR